MRHRAWTLAMLGLMAGVAHAAESTPGPTLEVLVVDDPFARWDDTRWMLETTVSLPYPATLYRERNGELQILGYELQAVVHCELGEARGKRAHEVDCLVEDASLSAVPWGPNQLDAGASIAENAERLTDLTVRLQVSRDGRVLGTQLVDEAKGSRRLNVQVENLRQVLSRAFVGFHLRSPERFVMGEQWVEPNSALFSLPAFRHTPIGVLSSAGAPIQIDGAPSSQALGSFQTVGDTTTTLGSSQDRGSLGGPTFEQFDHPNGVRAPLVPDALGRSPWDVLQAPASYGHSVVAHRMDPYKGRYVVQSVGEGTVDIGLDVPLTFRGDMEGVSVFRPDDGVMTERVWRITLAPTAGSLLADGGAGWPYNQTGKLRMLDEGEEVVLNAPAVLDPPSGSFGRGQLLPHW